MKLFTSLAVLTFIFMAVFWLIAMGGVIGGIELNQRAQAVACFFSAVAFLAAAGAGKLLLMFGAFDDEEDDLP